MNQSNLVAEKITAFITSIYLYACESILKTTGKRKMLQYQHCYTLLVFPTYSYGASSYVFGATRQKSAMVLSL